MNVLVITSRDLEKGSTKYRIAQYIDFLKEKGIQTEFIRRNEINGSLIRKLREFDLVYNQKCLINTYLSKKIISQTKRLIFDFDDAIYTRPRKPYSFITSLKVMKRFRFWLQHADIVTIANQFLASIAKRYSPSVVIVPMAIDTDLWQPLKKNSGTHITLGWAGAPVNVPNVERLNNVFCALLNKYQFLKLAVFSGKKPHLSCPFEFHPFQAGEEPSFMQGLDIGLLPLPNEEYSKGKSPIKALQYLACGVPVVGNVSGATAEILNKNNSLAVTSDSDWLEALETLINDHDLRKRLGAAGRQFIVNHHNIQNTREQLLHLFIRQGKK